MINHKELFLYVIKEGEVSRMIGIIGAMEEEVAAIKEYMEITETRSILYILSRNDKRAPSRFVTGWSRKS